MESGRICRVCESLDKNLELLYEGKNNQILTMLKSISNVSIHPNDGLPNWICTDCIEKLEISYDFRTQYSNTYEKFKCNLKQRRSENYDYQFKVELENYITNNKHTRKIDKVKDSKNEAAVKKEIIINEAEEIVVSELFDESDEESEMLDFSKTNKAIDDELNQLLEELASDTRTDLEDDDDDNDTTIIEKGKNKQQYPYKCKQCNKRFKAPAQLKIHCMLHSNPKSFQCDQCGRTYVEPHKLRAHQLLHEKPDLFKCKQCGKLFVNSTLLNEHLTVHRDPDRFKCYNCGRRFSRNTHLKRHLLLCTNQKEHFKCFRCDKVFVRNDEFQLHVKLHEIPDLFKCSKCTKTFKKNATLREHEMLHSNPDSFKCKLCGKVYKSASYLRMHQKQYHG